MLNSTVFFSPKFAESLLIKSSKFDFLIREKIIYVIVIIEFTDNKCVVEYSSILFR